MERTREYLKERFQTGKKPSQQDFHDLIETMVTQGEAGGAGSRLEVVEFSGSRYAGMPSAGTIVRCSEAMEEVRLQGEAPRGTGYMLFRAGGSLVLQAGAGQMVAGDIELIMADRVVVAGGRWYLVKVMPLVTTVTALYQPQELPVVEMEGGGRLTTEEGQLLTLEGRPTMD